ncbi:hypothetical protein [Spirulina major]|uniref:hypothetical protein n=1 Tax=Spirulina major TaxID=270636 RepID=UPI0011150240|nr:hypothetical protein [Spirulina major]
MTQPEKRDRAIHVRIDRLTESEQEQISSEIKRAKKRIAPDSRGTIVEGSMQSLPAQNSQSLDSEE